MQKKTNDGKIVPAFLLLLYSVHPVSTERLDVPQIHGVPLPPIRFDIVLRSPEPQFPAQTSAVHRVPENNTGRHTFSIQFHLEFARVLVYPALGQPMLS